MTVTEVAADERAVVGARIVYPDQAYYPDDLGHFLVAITRTWSLCVAVADFRATAMMLSDPTHTPPPNYMEHDTDRRSAWDIHFQNLTRYLYHIADGELSTGQGSGLRIGRMRIESPLDLTLVVEGGGTAVMVYALHLFVRALRDPRAIGSWIPRLILGWHEAMLQVEKAKASRGKEVEAGGPEIVAFTRAIDAVKHVDREGRSTENNPLLDLRPIEIELLGFSPTPPKDVLDAFGE